MLRYLTNVVFIRLWTAPLRTSRVAVLLLQSDVFIQNIVSNINYIENIITISIVRIN